MPNGIVIYAAALAGFVAMTTLVFAATASPASACAKAFATEVISKRDYHAGMPVVGPDPLRLVPCNLGDSGCQDMEWADPAIPEK